VLFKPLHAAIRNVIPTRSANLEFLLGIMFVLFSVQRSGDVVLSGPNAPRRLLLLSPNPLHPAAKIPSLLRIPSVLTS
ncbi:MAG TPA: hypothetical protein VMH20_16790, partial [Verrucomicrobiae bacterium]|nr:hypothetical protein [Verrucomicrobiae bacterium]